MEQVYVVNEQDNVGVAIHGAHADNVTLIGAHMGRTLELHQEISAGHKVALADIPAQGAVVKYGVVIGEATKDIHAGEWVHLHNMKSRYDERSGQIDPVTGETGDTVYE